MIRLRKTTPPKAAYLEFIRDKLLDIEREEVERQTEEEESAAALVAASLPAFNEEGLTADDIADDAEYEEDVPDIARQTLLEMFRSGMQR